jgi:hypothetical protein
MQSNSVEEIKKLNEAYEDSLFHVIMNNVAEAEGKLLLEENKQLNKECENLPSSESINRFTKLLDSHLKEAKNPQKNGRVFKLLRRTAVAMMAVIVILFGMAFSVQAVRVQILNFLISIEPEYTSLQLNDANNTQNNGKLIVNWTNAYVPTYIPDGYEVNSISYAKAIKKIIFSNPNNDLSIIYTEFSSLNTIAVDTEDASLVEKVKVNDHDGTLSIKDSITSIAWTIDNHLFVFQGQMSTDEAIKMAESVKFIK